jgi:aerobic carbon-monoxide dehydrogenase medium subunit
MFRLEPANAAMKPPPFQYHDPKSVEEAITILRSHSNAKLLAGGQSLMPMMNMRYVQPDHVVDLNKIESLSYIREEKHAIRIGAMTRQRELEFSPLIRERLPMMHEALMAVGHRQTRNRGTIGGSLCHLDPAAELPAVAMAYDALIEVSGVGRIREVPMAKFPAFYMTPAIEPEEIVTGLRFTPWPKGHGSAFVEFARRHGDFALASVGALIEREGAKIRRASITVGGLSHKPIRVTDAENVLASEPMSDDMLRKAADACGTIEATADIHGSAAYRQRVARTLAFRAISTAYGRAIAFQSGRPA